MLCGLMALVGMLPAPWLAAVPPLRIVSLVGSALLAAVAVYGWTALLANLLQQNNPQLARTLPGHVRGLRHTLWATAAALCAGAAGIVGMAGGSVLVGITFAALTCTGMTMVLRWPVLVFPLVALTWLAPGPFARETLVQAWQAVPLLATGFVVAVAACVLRGGARHERVHKRAALGAAAWSGDPAHAARRVAHGLAGRESTPRWLQPIAYAYDTSLRHALRRPSTLRQRLALGLGPMLSAPGVLIGAASVALIWIVPALIAWLFPQWALVQSINAGLNFAVGVVVLTINTQWPAILWVTRREQTLLRLLPGAPQGGALNRWLALRLSGLQALTAAFFLGLLLALQGLQGTGGQESQVAQASLVLSPLAVLMLWRDWSRMSAPQGIFSPAMLPVVAGVNVAAYAWVAGSGLGAGSLALLVLPLWMALAAWRWRVLGSKPAAWPVGRLAKAPSPGPASAN